MADMANTNSETAMMSSSTRTGSGKRKEKVKCYLVICNISKKNNVKSLLSLASAFGCYGVFIVGQKRMDIDPDSRDIPGPIRQFLRDGRMKLQRFDNWNDFMGHIQQQGIRLIGIEIHENAKPVDHYFDHVDTAFCPGNEGQGLLEKQMKTCHGFVRIPQYGNGTASLNVSVATSIILQRYYQWQQEVKNP